MKHYCLLLIITFILQLPLLAQDQNRPSQPQKRANVLDYKIISRSNEITNVDTTLTIYKEYKFNYLRKDDFDLLAFSNEGQSYNSLSIDFSSSKLLPLFGARARHFNYFEVDDIYYYNVPTPLTELFFKSVFEQGQLVDSFFTVNTSPNLNFSIGFKGLRSLGKFQNSLTSSRNFRFGTSYHSNNERYNLRLHITSQGLLNEENGGLTDEDVINFESGVEEFLDRSVFDPRFEDAENDLEGTRFYIEQTYKLRDSLDNNSLTIGNITSFEEKTYEFGQVSQNDFFGEAFINSNLSDKVEISDFYTEFNAIYSNSLLGDFKFNTRYSSFNYGYDGVIIVDNNTITNRLKGDVTSVGGAYKNKIGQFELQGDFGINIAGDFDGNFLNASAGYKINDDVYVSSNVNINSSPANYNLLLYQSDYINYNWQNDFDNVQTKQFKFNLASQKLVNLELDYTTIDNYAYFERQGTNNLVSPSQTSQTINYFRAKLSKEIKHKKFALNNTVRYQNVLDGEGILNVPDFNLRSTLYFTDRLFKKALLIQTGVTLSYFTSYNANSYDPLLAEFYVQNETEIGDFPRLDFFINAKVRQARIYLKAEHFNSSFTGFNFFSAPNYPYRDFVVRFGLVWNFFL